MTATFLDTSALYAAARPYSQHHDPCRVVYRQLLAAADPLLTTELVIAELHALTMSRHGPALALGIVYRLTASARVDVVPVDADRRDAGLDLLRARPGRRYSLADAVSFVVMRERGVNVAFTLDGDFVAEGFSVVPDRADPAG